MTPLATFSRCLSPSLQVLMPRLATALAREQKLTLNVVECHEICKDVRLFDIRFGTPHPPHPLEFDASAGRSAHC